MDEHNQTNYLANEVLPQDFDLEEILAEYQNAPEPEGRQAESLSERSKRIVLETLPDTLAAEAYDTLGGLIESTVAEEALAPEASSAAQAESPAAAAAPESEPDPDGAEEAAVLSEIELQMLVDEEKAMQYASADAAAPADEEADGSNAPEEVSGRRGGSGASVGERFLSPFVALAALITLRRVRRVKGERQSPTMDDADENVPEMPPEKAVKLYGSQMRSLQFRGRVATGLSLVMLYLSFAYYSPHLPLTGALHSGIRVLSLVLLIFELAVIMAGLDIFTAGLMGIVRRQMNAEGLIAASCLASLLDALVIAAFDLDAYGLPFCAVSAISLTFAVWGAYFNCQGHRSSFRVLKMKRELYTVTAERGIMESDVALLKSNRRAEGFIRRSEEADIGEYCYGTLTPFLLAAAVILGLLAGIGRGQARAVLHCISILIAVTATFSCTICFSVPFAVAAKRLFSSGAAIAGWSGVRDIGRSRHVVITDSDVFPKGTAEIDNIRVLEGAFTDKVISYTASVVAAGGSGLAEAFSDIVRRNGYTICRVENFEPHDGGGLTAIVNGDSVCVGNTGFMNLMGIRLPQKLSTRYSLYTAINGALVGIFTVAYKPISSVQGAMLLLQRSRLSPIFAIRDFNVTPVMIRAKFKLRTDSFLFPPYAERFRISGTEPDRSSRVAAVIAREGMGPLVDAAERGKRLHLGVQAATAVSAVGSVFGLLMMFLLCWMGAFDSATVSNVITFMLLWLIPLALIVANLYR